MLLGHHNTAQKLVYPGNLYFRGNTLFIYWSICPGAVKNTPSRAFELRSKLFHFTDFYSTLNALKNLANIILIVSLILFLCSSTSSKVCIFSRTSTAKSISSKKHVNARDKSTSASRYDILDIGFTHHIASLIQNRKLHRSQAIWDALTILQHSCLQ